MHVFMPKIPILEARQTASGYTALVGQRYIHTRLTWLASSPAAILPYSAFSSCIIEAVLRKFTSKEV